MMQPGEIWLVNLADAKGHEQQGRRPGLIVGQANGLVITIPLTSALHTARFSHTYPLPRSTHNGLNSESVALIFQIVALDGTRFIHKIGEVGGGQMAAIRALMKDLLRIT